ncbi:MAG: hypothetical protein F6K65_14550 [Moorea sp. SIO3C2]|nr:hypothetical protein [Moorena sp. SIO3C2]
MAKRPRDRVQPSTFNLETLAKRPRDRVQPSTLKPSTCNLNLKDYGN